MKKTQELFYSMKLKLHLVSKRSWWSMIMAILCIILGYMFYLHQPIIENDSINFYEQKFYLSINYFGINFLLGSIFLLSLISIFKKLNIIDIVSRIVIGVISGIIIGIIIWMILIFITIELDLLSSFKLAMNVGLLLGQISAFLMIFKDIVVEIFNGE